jgi:hypothetical protein
VFRQPLPGASRHQGIALASRNYVIPLSFLSLRQGTRESSVDLGAGQPLPISKMVLREQWFKNESPGLNANAFRDNLRGFS